jgi:hypothetical protein
MLDCRTRRGYNLSTDHKLLVATLKTPCNRAARFKHRKTPPSITKKLDLTALLIPETKDAFSHQVSAKLQKGPTPFTITNISDRLVTVLKEAATETLSLRNRNRCKHDEIFRNYTELNALLDQRAQSHWPRKSSQYKKQNLKN